MARGAGGSGWRLYSGDGAEGIDAILAARQQAGSDVAFAAFDILTVGDHEVMAEPWSDRRKRLDDVFGAGIAEPRVQLVPACDDAARLWSAWVVDRGGEGIVLKDRRSVYRRAHVEARRAASPGMSAASA